MIIYPAMIIYCILSAISFGIGQFGTGSFFLALTVVLATVVSMLRKKTEQSTEDTHS